MLINTESFSARLRERLVDSVHQRVLIARLTDTVMETDRYTQVNCGGFGRIREFSSYKLHLENSVRVGPPRPLLRGHANVAMLRSQVFQLAGCNWRCWYCFVDDDRLSAVAHAGALLSCDDLLDYYLAENDRPDIIDLSGGQPDLVPEWNLWMMKAMKRRGLASKVYLWTDDNLSNDYLWRYLTRSDIAYMASFPRYSRMGCFKGYDETSFSFNTNAPGTDFDVQFEIMRALVRDGFNVFAYATFTTPSLAGLLPAMATFVDKLQSIHPNLPLRTIPLRIAEFATTRGRMRETHERAIRSQHEAFAAWEHELSRRFSWRDRHQPFDSAPLK